MLLVVEPDADDLARIRDHGKKGDFRELEIRLGAFRGLGGLDERAAREQGAQVRIFFADAAREVDDALADDDAVAGAL